MFVTLNRCPRSEWIKDLNIMLEILKLVYAKAGNTLEAIGIG
jgi:hypothetical protein